MRALVIGVLCFWAALLASNLLLALLIGWWPTMGMWMPILTLVAGSLASGVAMVRLSTRPVFHALRVGVIGSGSAFLILTSHESYVPTTASDTLLTYTTFLIPVMLGSGILCAAAFASPAASPASNETPSIALTPCAIQAVRASARCGVLEVPENPDKPRGRQLSIRIVVVPAISGQALRDPVVPLMGGPGEDAISSASLFAEWFASLRQDRDLLFVDQRGTGQSSPLRCTLHPDGDAAANVRDFFPPAAVRRCAEELQVHADLTQYTYRHFANDLESVRRGLGYGPLDLFAGSYGTRAAQVFIKTHPKSVRTIFLWSVVPISVATPTAFAGAAQAMLENTLKLCEADAACHAAYPNLRSEFSDVLAELDRGEVRVSVPGVADPVPLSRGRVAEWFRAMLYRPSRAAQLPWAIHEAHRGNWDPIARPMFATDSQRDKEISVGIFFSITCSEDMPFVNEKEAAAAAKGTALGDYRLRQQQQACALWPKATLPKGYRDPVRSDVPALFVSGGSDGGSPLWFTRTVAPGFPNRLEVVLQNRGHTEWSDCVGDLFTRFVRAGSVKDLDGSACEPAEPPAFRVH